MSGEGRIRTPSSWTVSFFVNIRTAKRSYRVLDYQGSNLELLRGSADLRAILRCLRAVPPLTRLRNGSLSLFRDGIKNVWEDPENAGGYILKATAATAREAALRHCAACRRLCPVVDPADLQDLWEFLALLAVSGALGRGEHALNGLYCKAADSIVTLELWFRSRPALEAAEGRLRGALGRLGLETAFRPEEVPAYKFLAECPGGEVRVGLGDTFRITSMQTGVTRGRSAGRDGGEELWAPRRPPPRGPRGAGPGGGGGGGRAGGRQGGGLKGRLEGRPEVCLEGRRRAFSEANLGPDSDSRLGGGLDKFDRLDIAMEARSERSEAPPDRHPEGESEADTLASTTASLAPAEPGGTPQGGGWPAGAWGARGEARGEARGDEPGNVPRARAGAPPALGPGVGLAGAPRPCVRAGRGAGRGAGQERGLAGA